MAGCGANDAATPAPSEAQVAPAALSYPTELVNGDFEAYSWNALTGDRNDWTSVEPATGLSLNGPEGFWKHKIDGWDRAKFAWTSSQTADDRNIEQRAGAVELQREKDTGNIYAELAAYQAGTAIYQDIDTEHDSPTVYTIRLKHTSMSRTWVDKMQVMVGAPGQEQPVEMTRVTSNGNGDRTGEKSDVISTVASNKPDVSCDNEAKCTARNHQGQWEEYTGSVLVPAGRRVTRFTFRNVSSTSLNYGNLIDDVSFQLAYPLHYDANGGQGQTPEQTE